MRKAIVYIANSLDGYIARPDGGIDWLSLAELPGEDYGYATFYAEVDTVLMGRKTYDTVIAMGIPFPHADKTTYILSHSLKEDKGLLRFYSGNPGDLIREIKQSPGGNIFIDGGSEVIAQLLETDAIDEWVISTLPVLLGQGISLLKPGGYERKLELVSVKAFESGLVQHHYRKYAG